MRRDTLNGDETDIDECEGTPSLLCEDDGDGPVIAEFNGNNVETDAVGEEPFGVFNRTDTETDGFGLSLQTTLDGTLKGIEKTFIFGGAIDVGRTRFSNDTEIGTLTDTRTVNPSGIFIAGGAFSTRLTATNQYAGIYAMNVTALTTKLDLTLSGRFNYARVKLEDRMGDALNGDHSFRRLNPAAGRTELRRSRSALPLPTRFRG